MVTVRVPDWALWVGLGAAGIVHLLVPRLLLRTAATLYDRVLGVRFEPTPRAARRVRAIGLCMVAVAGALRRLLGRSPTAGG